VLSIGYAQDQALESGRLLGQSGLRLGLGGKQRVAFDPKQTSRLQPQMSAIRGAKGICAERRGAEFPTACHRKQPVLSTVRPCFGQNCNECLVVRRAGGNPTASFA
jgi:hypothetical protein